MVGTRWVTINTVLSPVFCFKALRKSLKEKTGGSTVLIVTQRVPTIKNSEQIIVLDEGRIVGKGKHQDLMKSCDVYREIALSQVSQEELS